MTPSERTFTRLLQSRLGAVALMALGFVAVTVAKGVASLPAVATGRGLVTGTAVADFIGDPWSFIGALAMMAFIMGAMSVINSTFNLLRTSSLLFLGVFAVMEAASPLISTRLCSGMAVAVIVLLSMGLMYSVYQRPASGSRRIFLVFFMLSAGTMVQYAFLAYLPVFLLGCVQMRCFRLRTLMASLAGVVTPWWMLWGFGLLDWSDVDFPAGFSIFSDLDTGDKAQLISVIVVTVITGFALTLTNMVKVYSYNARSRSFTGLLVLVTIATLLMTMIDIANVTTYLTLLNCCVAFQTALCFRINVENRGYIPVVVILSCYLILYVWSLII